jgi:hypothetical protein
LRARGRGIHEELVEIEVVHANLCGHELVEECAEEVGERGLLTSSSSFL